MFEQLLDLFTDTLPQITGPEPTGTFRFFLWYFYGMGGIGGWLIFLLLALATLFWLYYDSQKRRLPANGWRMGVVILTLLLLPTILYRFTVTSVHTELYRIIRTLGPMCNVVDVLQLFPGIVASSCDALLRTLPPLTPYGEYVFYLGILGGILAPVLAIGYYITFQGMVGCVNGHVYDSALERCPRCARQESRPTGWTTPPPQVAGPGQPGHRPSKPQAPPKPTLGYAWLMDLSTNRRYDLVEGTTKIGRDAQNDIVLADPSVSRTHAQIREAQGHCTLADLDSRSGTLLNEKRLRTPQVLQNGDRIALGDTVLQYISSRG